MCGEVKAALYTEDKRPRIVSFVGGLGGRDVLPEEFEKMVERGFLMAERGQERSYEMIGVRE